MKFLSTLAFTVFLITDVHAANMSESWTCYRHGSEYIKVTINKDGYQAHLSGTIDDVVLTRQSSDKNKMEFTGRELPFYDTINYRIILDRTAYQEDRLERQVFKTKAQVIKDGYYDCQGDFMESETLECSAEFF